MTLWRALRYSRPEAGRFHAYESSLHADMYRGASEKEDRTSIVAQSYEVQPAHRGMAAAFPVQLNGCTQTVSVQYAPRRLRDTYHAPKQVFPNLLLFCLLQYRRGLEWNPSDCCYTRLSTGERCLIEVPERIDIVQSRALLTDQKQLLYACMHGSRGLQCKSECHREWDRQ